jgi:cytochrome c-type biogenesis protein CcsB
MKFFRLVFSGTFMGILLVIFAISIGYATFIENDFDAATAKMLIFNARWFEILLFLMVVNFAGMIFTRQLYRKSKINIMLIHVSLIIIIIGAGLTRYIGFEGQMHIRQGETTDRYISTDTYMSVHFESGSDKSSFNKRIWLSPVRPILFDENIKFDQSSYDIILDHYIPNATEVLAPDPNGTAILSLATAGASGVEEMILEYGNVISKNGMNIGFGDISGTADVQFFMDGGALKAKLPHVHTEGEVHEPGQDMGTVELVTLTKVYNLPTMNMMVKDFSESAVPTYAPVENENKKGSRVAKVTIKNNENSKQVYLKWGKWEPVVIGDVTVSLKFGNQNWVLPFSLRLNEFELERYPGSMSPSSFASEITLIDQKNNVEKPYRIFMNNILEYKGYRFYQSSYDTDEKGTILSVNHDYWGTMVTYFGYFLLFATLIISLFTKKTRFVRVSEQIKETHDQRKKLLVSVLLMLLCFAGSYSSFAKDDNEISREHAAEFGKVLVQNKDGRIIPVNTNSDQLLVKVYKKSSFEGLNADQVFLGMISNPLHWQDVKMIRVNDPELAKVLGIEGDLARYSNFFNDKGQYVLKAQIDEAYAKKPAERNMFDKELIYVDERINVSYMVYNGSFLKFFPIPDHPDSKWISPMEFNKDIDPADANNARALFSSYLEKLRAGIETGNYTEANTALQKIKDYQSKEGTELIPSQTKVNIEILYNKINIFKSLFPVYMLLGMILFGFFFVQIFKPALEFKFIVNLLVGILVICFVLQTIGLGLRWYIAGHAPWSNGYESMIYISWATMLAGFIFMKKSAIILSVTSLLAGVTLLTAHMSWMNPEITNLVPVLKSYWLTIHVATITASYGFLALGGLTAFLNLMIMIFRNKQNALRVNLTLKELSLIIELSFTVGLILLVIGNFLGGIWANESWGRYWGWDPKETWSLVTIIVYSFILHMRLIPGLRNTFSFNFLSMFAFSSVLMTYFGVNYYLSGLHSYASGDPVPVPSFVYYTLIILLTISVFAFLNNKKFIEESENFIT